MSSCLWRELYDRSLSAEERLKVACFLWRSEDGAETVVGSRELALCRWASEEIVTAYNKKTRVPPSPWVCSQLWEFFSSAVNSCSRLDTHRPLPHVTLSHQLIEALIRVLDEAQSEEEQGLSCVAKALDSLGNILTLSPLPPPLYSYELMVTLLQSVLALVLEEGPSEHTLSIFTVVSRLLKHYARLQRTQGNQKKVFLATCTHLLQPVLSVKSLLLSLSLADETKREAEFSINDILCSLFGKDQLLQFTSTMDCAPVPREDVPGKHRSTGSYVRVLFETLEKMLKTSGDELYITNVSGVPVVFNAFLSQNSKEHKVTKKVEFEMFSKLVHLLGCDIQPFEQSSLKRAEEDKQEVNEDDLSERSEEAYGGTKELVPLTCSLHLKLCKESSASVSEFGQEEDMDVSISTDNLKRCALASVSECVHLLLNYNVFQLSEDQVSGSKQLLYLQGLAKHMLQQCNLHNLAAVFRCLTGLLKLSHKTTELLLPCVWAALLSLPPGALKQNEVETFVQECIGIYAKLRQLPALLSKQLTALEVLLAGDISISTNPAFSPTAENKFAQCISELPPGQTLEILRLISLKFSSEYLPTLESCRGRDKKGTVKSPVLVSFPHLRRVRLESLCSLLQRFVDIASVVLSSVSLSTWSGRLKEEASAFLRDAHQKMCVSFLCLVPSLPSAMQSSMCSSSLLLTLRLLRLEWSLIEEQAIDGGQLSDDSTRLLWQPAAQTPLPVCWSDLSDKMLGPASKYVLKELAILAMKRGEHCDSEVLDFIFEGLCLVSSDAQWTGQISSINETNYSLAVVCLVISQLSFLYCRCGPTHLVGVAGSILEGLLQCGISQEYQRSTLCSVVIPFVHSEDFQEMKKLHKEVFSLCCSNSARLLPKCFPEDFGKAFQQCSSEEKLSENWYTTVISHTPPDSFPETGRKVTKKLTKWLDLLTAYQQLLCVIPLEFMSVVFLKKCLLAVTTWLSSTSHLMAHPSFAAAAISVSTDLLILMSLLFHVLGKWQRRLKTSMKKAFVVADIPLEAIVEWTTNISLRCLRSRDSPSISEECRLGLLSSSLMCNEFGLGLGLQTGLCHTALLTKTGTKLKKAVKRQRHDLKVFYMEESFKTAVSLICKMYSAMQPTHKQFAVLKAAVGVLWETLLSILDFCPSHSSEYPALSSALVVLVPCADRPVPDCARAVITVAPTLHNCDNLSRSTWLQKMVGILDLLSLPASCLGKVHSDSVEQNMHVAVNRAMAILQFLFEQNGYQLALCSLLATSYSRGSSIENAAWKSPKEEIMHVLVQKSIAVISQLLVACNRQEIATIFESLSRLEATSLVASAVFCCSWHAVLHSKLSEECERERRKWLDKVLLKCQAIAGQHRTDSGAISMALLLITDLVGVHHQVGLSARSAVMALSLCSCINNPSHSSKSLLHLAECTCNLLNTLLRNHTAVAAAAPAPFLTAMNNLLRLVLQLGQESMLEPCSQRDLVPHPAGHCADRVTRLMMNVASQDSFSKFAVYSVGEFAVTSQRLPMAPDVKKLLLPGVFSLLKLCSDEDTAFIKASLDETARENFQTLLTDYKKFHKFSGRV